MAGHRFWFQDASHFPRPVSRVAQAIDVAAMAAGFGRAADVLRRPLAGRYTRVRHGYVYFGLDVPASAAALARAERAYQAALESRMATALADWTGRYQPEAERITAALLDLARPERSDAELAAALPRLVELRARQWEIHDLALVPAMAAAARLTERWGPRLGGDEAAHRLLRGFPNRATAAAEALDVLAAQVRERPALLAVLLAGPPPSGDDPRGLTDGGWFAEAAAAYLAEYGHRAGGWDLGEPTWIEESRPFFALLLARLRRPPETPGARRAEAAAAREQATRAAFAALDGAERDAFAADLRAAQAYPVISEDHNALIDQAGMAAVRAVILEAGRRLTRRGSLGRADDAVHLTPTELSAALDGPLVAGGLVRRRRALAGRRAALAPGPTLGAPLPDWAAANPTLRQFFGLRAADGVATAVLHGTGVSAGVATGPVQVVRRLEEVEALPDGAVLVCRMTSPAWTPLLALAAAVVTETGGMLSHTAILARELGIPCIVNVPDALALLDGARVRVDGGRGTVTLLDPAVGILAEPDADVGQDESGS